MFSFKFYTKTGLEEHNLNFEKYGKWLKFKKEPLRASPKIAIQKTFFEAQIQKKGKNERKCLKMKEISILK